MFTVAKGSQVTELTLPADSLEAIATCPECFEGMAASMGSGEVISFQAACRFPQEVALAALRQR